MSIIVKTKLVTRIFTGESVNSVEDQFLEWSELRGKVINKLSWCLDGTFYLESTMKIEN